MNLKRPLAALAAVLALVADAALGQDLRLPNKPGSLKFAVIGDTGTASRAQNEVGALMAAFRQKFPFELVLMVGDNMYGRQGPKDYVDKFEAPYKAMLDAGVKFYAALGNHDDPGQRNYKFFNMAGERYYTFRGTSGLIDHVGGTGVRFFALDSNYMDKAQIDWLEKELADSVSEWKICFFHHPLYSSARKHGSSLDLRAILEPLFVRYGVSVVFTGHDHVYERTKPQKGITYFVSGAGGSLRKGDLRKSEFTAVGYDQDFHFMLAEIDGDEMHFQAVARTGTVVDAGRVTRTPAPATASGR
jgi:3',5'-cyclic AMP phosphodiesterase CpdA